VPVKLQPISLGKIVRWVAIFLPFLVIVVLYTYAYFVKQPYTGFELAEDRVAVVHSADKSLQVDDRVIRIGNVSIAEYNDDLYKTLGKGIHGGDSIIIEIERDGTFLLVNWKVPEAAKNQFTFRLFITPWWMGWVFVIMGGVVLWRRQPNDKQLLILITFFFTMAIMCITSTVAWWHVWGGAILQRTIIWFVLPISLHLHWVFPKPLTPIPRSILFLGYAASVLAAFAEQFRWLPKEAYIIAFTVAMLGSLFLHLIRLRAQEDQRRDTLLLVASLSIPSISLGITSLIAFFSKEVPLTLLAVGFYTLGIIPIAYSYVSNRHRSDHFETQFNQVTALGLFTATIVLMAAIANEVLRRFVGTLSFASITPLFTFAGFFAGVVLTAYAYPHFKERVLDISRALYQENIDRSEAYRAAISRELHDSTSQFKFIKKEIAQLNPPSEFWVKWDGVMNSIRHAINDLRPKMLDFGVGPALLHLRDQLDEQTGGELNITLNVKGDNHRYDLHAEQHIYRIIQQACENSLQHAHATSLTLIGSLDPSRVEMTVEDNGVGFPFYGDSDVAAFVTHQRFGVAGMFERAHIIRASLKIDSEPGQGTRVHLIWRP